MSSRFHVTVRFPDGEETFFVVGFPTEAAAQADANKRNARAANDVQCYKELDIEHVANVYGVKEISDAQQ